MAKKPFINLIINNKTPLSISDGDGVSSGYFCLLSKDLKKSPRVMKILNLKGQDAALVTGGHTRLCLKSQWQRKDKASGGPWMKGSRVMPTGLYPDRLGHGGKRGKEREFWGQNWLIRSSNKANVIDNRDKDKSFPLNNTNNIFLYKDAINSN